MRVPSYVLQIFQDSQIYSSAQATIPHLYLYITPLSERWCSCPLGWLGLWWSCLLKVHLYAMFVADVFAVFTKPFGIWHHYMHVLVFPLCCGVPHVVGTSIYGQVGLVTFWPYLEPNWSILVVLVWGVLPLPAVGVEQQVLALCVNLSLNRNIGKYHLPNAWDEVLVNTSELKQNNLQQ